MHDENPTAGDSGASITERLEQYLAAEDAPEPEQREAKSAEPDIAEEVPVDTGSDDASEDDGPQITTADLAKYLGIDESALDVNDAGEVSFKTKIDGQEGAAKLSDFLKSYQLQGHIDNKSRELAENQRAIQARMAEVEQFAQQRLQQVEDLASFAMNDLTREYNSIDWQSLRAADPAEYVARQHDYQARYNQLQSALQGAQAQREQYAMQTGQQQSAQYQQYLMQQNEKLLNALPEWKDMEKAKAGKTEIRSYLQSQGFNDSEISTASDHRHILIARKAMLYDQLQKAKPAVENKVRTAPKIVKPGQAVANRQESSVRSLKSTIRNSGGKQGIVEYLLATGKA